jgi:protein translocase SecG subunit
MLLKFLETPLTVLHICVSLFLVLVILIQPGKSGGLGAALGARVHSKCSAAVARVTSCRA